MLCMLSWGWGPGPEAGSCFNRQVNPTLRPNCIGCGHTQSEHQRGNAPPPPPPFLSAPLPPTCTRTPLRSSRYEGGLPRKEGGGVDFSKVGGGAAPAMHGSVGGGSSPGARCWIQAKACPAWHGSCGISDPPHPLLPSPPAHTTTITTTSSNTPTHHSPTLPHPRTFSARPRT